MNNFIISLKRFFTNKNTVTVLGVLLGILILYIGYTMRVNSAIKPVRVPYAKVAIQPRTKITTDMIDYMDVRPESLKGSVVTNVSQIIGKYANYNTVIPNGSMFYGDALIEYDELPDSAFGKEIPSDYSVFNFPVSMTTTYGNSMFPGNYINMYFKAIGDDGKVIIGKLISNIRILDVKDSNGRHVFENTQEARIPAALIFAVPEEMHLLLRKATYLRDISAELIPVPVTEALPTDGELVEFSSQYLKEFINSKTAIVPIEELPAGTPEVTP